MKNLLSLALMVLINVVIIAQPYPVGHVQVTYNDAARSNRAVASEMYYPATIAGESTPCVNDTFPLVVFGHGFVMTWSAYQNTWEALVAEGYVVVFPTTEGSFSPVHAEFGADLAFLITAVQQDAATNSNSLLYNHLGTRSALMGHSMGGGSAFLAAAASTNATTLVTYAAANTNPSSIAAATNVTIPSLVIAGQNDCVAPPVQHQLPMYDSLSSSCKAYVSISGGGHCYFAETNFNCSFGEGTCSPNPTITRAQQQDAAEDVTLLWLNYYLKGNCSALNAFNDTMQMSQRMTGTYTCGHTSPVISLNGNLLQSTPAASYQWLFNGSPVSGATTDTIHPLQPGNYSVVTEYSNSDCPDTSNVINWIAQRIDEHSGVAAVELYPVPANDFVQVNITSDQSIDGMLMINNALGQAVRIIPVQTTGASVISIDVKDLAAGHYMIQLMNADHQLITCERMVVVHD